MATTTKIQASSRVSIKVNDTFYTVEYSEERSVAENENLEEARQELWDCTNGEVDKQVDEIYQMYKKK